MADSWTDLIDLSRSLQQDKLFTSVEKQSIAALNDKVSRATDRLFQLAWISRQQRLNLDGLILSRPDSTPAVCCQRVSLYESANFVEGYRHLGHTESSYGEFLQLMRDNPRLMAVCLATGETMGQLHQMHEVSNIVLGSVHGHCLLNEDEFFVLQLLRHLVELQLSTSDNPRRLLRHGSCAFSRMYKPFSEGLNSAKLFLTASLHDAIMHLLMEDELFFDIDPGKAVIRFPPLERMRRFGKEGTPEYEANLKKYRNWIISKLVNLTNRFISGIRSNLYCFPAGIAWLINQVYFSAIKAERVDTREVGAMCADLVLAFFICPAIVNPELYGICDAPISNIARFNLIQVAQIVQALAMSKWEEPDPKLADLYSKFDKNCMGSILDAMLDNKGDDLPFDHSRVLSGLQRTSVFITQTDLQSLVSFLRMVLTECSAVDRKLLETVLNLVPATTGTPTAGTNSSSCTPTKDTISVSTEKGTSGSSGHVSKKPLFGKVSKTWRSVNINSDDVHGSAAVGGGAGDSNNVLSSTNKIKQPSPLFPLSTGDDIAGGGSANSPKRMIQQLTSAPLSNCLNQEDVLVISIASGSRELPGMQSEQKILSERKQGRVRVNVADSGPSVGGDEAEIASLTGTETTEKRTRFSLSHDQDSIGNTSDNLEVISEANSNHSDESSIEMENDNDNLSDMISANVSGRGTPNVSGRDTPSSQVEEDDLEANRGHGDDDVNDAPNEVNAVHRSGSGTPPDAQSIVEVIGDQVRMDGDSGGGGAGAENVKRRPREDINDRFGKFDIKPLLSGDETVSLISDTWSTDVIGSDSDVLEQIEQAAGSTGTPAVILGGANKGLGLIAPLGLRGRSLLDDIMIPDELPPPLHVPVIHMGCPPGMQVNIPLDLMSETASEAWSMDVAASDSERLFDVDTDDCGSVARSDDLTSLAGGNRTDDYAASNRSDVGDDFGQQFGEGRPSVASDVPDDGWDVQLRRRQRRGQQESAMDLQPSTSQERNDMQRLQDLVSGTDSSVNYLQGEQVDLAGGLELDGAEICNQLPEITNRESPMQVTEDCSNLSPSDAGPRTTVQKLQDDQSCGGSEFDDMFSRVLLRTNRSSLPGELGGMQSLGRLSLAAAELPDNGLPTTDVIKLSTGAPSSVLGQLRSADDRSSGVRLRSAVSVGSAFTPVNRNNVGLICDDWNGFRNARFDSTLATMASSSNPSVSELSETNMETNDCFETDVAAEQSQRSSDLSCTTRISGQSMVSTTTGESGSGEEGIADTSRPGLQSYGVSISITDSSPIENGCDFGASSGAIPKLYYVGKHKSMGQNVSVTNERELSDCDDVKNRRGFFKGFKLPKLGNKGKKISTVSRQQEDGPTGVGLAGKHKQDKSDSGENSRLRRLHTEEINRGSSSASNYESSEDILAKYRRKQQLSTSPSQQDSSGSAPANVLNNSSSVTAELCRRSVVKQSENRDSGLGCSDTDQGGAGTACIDGVDPQNPELSSAFVDIKRKLRLVLSMADTQSVPCADSVCSRFVSMGATTRRENKLVVFLRMLLAESLNVQERGQVAQLHESIRCVENFDDIGCRKLLRSLKEDLRKRSPYVAYLIRSRQALLLTNSHLEKLINRIERDKDVCNQFVVSVCVRLFLEKKECQLQPFMDGFQRLTVSDEKTEYVEQFLNFLYAKIDSDDTWHGASEEQRHQARRTTERNIMSQIYIYAIYPNGDGDVHRDQVLHQHMQKLSNVITPSHRDLKIPKIYHFECPWPSAQAEIVNINAYKTPCDKLQCVLRCSQTIINLLTMADESTVPAADDFMPVLIYVMIAANPPGLLSAVQYVNSFYGKRLHGEEEYWWTQFCSAVEFVKTMDYTD